MKIRKGFISNSSSTSFCLYGWKFNDIREIFPTIKEIADKLEEEFDPSEIIIENWDDREKLIGIGNVDFKVCSSTIMDSPSEIKKKQVEKFAEYFNLPEPETYSDTFNDFC